MKQLGGGDTLISWLTLLPPLLRGSGVADPGMPRKLDPRGRPTYNQRSSATVQSLNGQLQCLKKASRTISSLVFSRTK